jgi:hypothetical protein
MTSPASRAGRLATGARDVVIVVLRYGCRLVFLVIAVRTLLAAVAPGVSVTYRLEALGAVALELGWVVVLCYPRRIMSWIALHVAHVAPPPRALPGAACPAAASSSEVRAPDEMGSSDEVGSPDEVCAA